MLPAPAKDNAVPNSTNFHRPRADTRRNHTRDSPDPIEPSFLIEYHLSRTFCVSSVDTNARDNRRHSRLLRRRFRGAGIRCAGQSASARRCLYPVSLCRARCPWEWDRVQRRWSAIGRSNGLSLAARDRGANASWRRCCVCGNRSQFNRRRHLGRAVRLLSAPPFGRVEGLALALLIPAYRHWV